MSKGTELNPRCPSLLAQIDRLDDWRRSSDRKAWFCPWDSYPRNIDVSQLRWPGGSAEEGWAAEAVLFGRVPEGSVSIDVRR